MYSCSIYDRPWLSEMGLRYKAKRMGVSGFGNSEKAAMEELALNMGKDFISAEFKER